MQHKTVGTPRTFEVGWEDQTNMMMRFLIHFMFTEHNHKIIECFDGTDPVF